MGSVSLVDGHIDEPDVIHCRDCEHHHWEQEPCHGRTIHICHMLNTVVSKDFYCGYGKRKENTNG